MNTQAAHPEVTQYVAQVRAHLADLSHDEVEELTAGLEADLTDAREESDGAQAWRARVGEPASYAAELRAAGGLPPSRAVADRAAPADPVARAVERWDAWTKPEWLRALLDLARIFAPLGWVVRAMAAAAIMILVFGVVSLPSMVFSLIAIGGLLALSIWLGLKVRRGNVWARVVSAAGNLFAAVIIALFLIAVMGRGASSPHYEDQPVGTVSGLAVDGEPVTNLFAYDADGNRVERVRLFDQTGRPVIVYAERVTPDGGLESQEKTVFPVETGGDPWRPATTEDGLQPWEPALRLTPLQLVSPKATTSPTTGTGTSSDGPRPTGPRTSTPSPTP